MKKVELLSPAGDFETALSAFAAGADAVYCGLGEYSARAYAGNFTFEELSRLVSFARSGGKKVYVAFNTLVDEADVASAADAQSESILRELLYRGDIPITVKLHAVFFLRLRGADMEKLMPPDMDVQDGMLPESADLLEDMPIGERQLVRFADEILSREYGITACSALTLMWQAYRHGCRKDTDPLVCTQEAAAALAWNYLLAHGKNAKPAKLAAQFECRLRRMVFYARHMAAVLERFEGNKPNEDH